MFVVYCPEEIRFVCRAHLAERAEFPFEQIGNSRLIKTALDEAERILEGLLAGKVVKFIHLKHPEVCWAIWDREKERFFERIVNSLTGEIFGPFEFGRFQDYYDNLGKAIANGWIAVVTNFQPDEIFSDGGDL
jgi:hypothetical protein